MLVEVGRMPPHHPNAPVSQHRANAVEALAGGFAWSRSASRVQPYRGHATYGGKRLRRSLAEPSGRCGVRGARGVSKGTDRSGGLLTVKRDTQGGRTTIRFPFRGSRTRAVFPAISQDAHICSLFAGPRGENPDSAPPTAAVQPPRESCDPSHQSHHSFRARRKSLRRSN